jgi:hypothetical protein
MNLRLSSRGQHYVRWQSPLQITILAVTIIHSRSGKTPASNRDKRMAWPVTDNPDAASFVSPMSNLLLLLRLQQVSARISPPLISLVRLIFPVFYTFTL